MKLRSESRMHYKYALFPVISYRYPLIMNISYSRDNFCLNAPLDYTNWNKLRPLLPDSCRSGMSSGGRRVGHLVSALRTNSVLLLPHVSFPLIG